MSEKEIIIKYDKITSLSSYLTNLLCSLTEKAGKEDHIRSLKYVCNIHVESISTSCDILSFKIEKSEMDNYVDAGYLEMTRFLQNH